MWVFSTNVDNCDEFLWQSCVAWLVDADWEVGLMVRPRGALLVRTRPQRGGGDPPPLYGPQNCRTEQGALSAPEAPEILF